MKGSWTVGRLFGVRIEITPSWLLIFGLLTFSLATHWFPHSVSGLGNGAYLALGALAALLLFLSVLVHELAHTLVARARGLSVSSITLFIFGGVSNLKEEPRTAGMEFQISIVGPLTSLVLGALAFGIGAIIPTNQPGVAAMVGYVAYANLLLGAFNLIPGFPLDGGRVLQSIIWGITGDARKALRWAAGVGQGFGWLFIGYGILQVFAGDIFGGLWVGLIGWFLLSAAQSASTEATLEATLGNLTVSQVMNARPPTVAANRTLAQFVETVVLPTSTTLAPVEQSGQLVGMITLDALQRYPRDQWDQVTVGQALLPLEGWGVAQPTQRVLDALGKMVGNGVAQMPVIDADGRLVGMLTRDAIMHQIAIRQRLAHTKVTPAPHAA